MVRRFIFTAVATVGLVSLPLAAMAYDAPGYTTTVSDPTPAIGQPITVATDGDVPGEQLTLTVTCPGFQNDAIEIAGTRALAKTANGSGDATWTVTFSSAGGCTLAVTNAAGALVGDAVVTVGDAVVTVAAAPGPSFLAVTGLAPLSIIGGSLLLLALGGVAVAARRRHATA